MTVKTSTPQLHSVLLKSGGAKICVLRNRKITEVVNSFRVSSDDVIAKRQKDMAGYAIVAISIEGCVSTAMHPSDTRHIGMTEFPDFVRTALIRHWDE